MGFGQAGYLFTGGGGGNAGPNPWNLIDPTGWLFTNTGSVLTGTPTVDPVTKIGSVAQAAGAGAVTTGGAMASLVSPTALLMPDGTTLDTSADNIWNLQFLLELWPGVTPANNNQAVTVGVCVPNTSSAATDCVFVSGAGVAASGAATTVYALLADKGTAALSLSTASTRQIFNPFTLIPSDLGVTWALLNSSPVTRVGNRLEFTGTSGRNDFLQESYQGPLGLAFCFGRRTTISSGGTPITFRAWWRYAGATPVAAADFPLV